MLEAGRTPVSHLVERPAWSGEQLNTWWGSPADTLTHFSHPLYKLSMMMVLNVKKKKKRLAWSTEKSELRSRLFKSLLTNASCPHLENFRAC